MRAFGCRELIALLLNYATDYNHNGGNFEYLSTLGAAIMVLNPMGLFITSSLGKLLMIQTKELPYIHINEVHIG